MSSMTGLPRITAALVLRLCFYHLLIWLANVMKILRHGYCVQRACAVACCCISTRLYMCKQRLTVFLEQGCNIPADCMILMVKLVMSTSIAKLSELLCQVVHSLQHHGITHTDLPCSCPLDEIQVPNCIHDDGVLWPQLIPENCGSSPGEVGGAIILYLWALSCKNE